jgi:tetratricopeptide (TPR) repeat protein
MRQRAFLLVLSCLIAASLTGGAARAAAAANDAATSVALPLDASSKWSAANDAYQKLNFDAAAKTYEELLAQGVTDANLFYNLGNAYYQLNQRGKAALMYEKALRLAPRLADARKNLRLARGPIPHADEGVFVLFRPLSWLCGQFTASEWAGWILGVSFAASLFAAAWILLRAGRARKVFAMGTLAALTILVVLVCFFAARYADTELRHYGVVIASGAVVRSAPAANADQYFEAREGERYLVEDAEMSGWFRVKHPSTGRVGYLSESAVQRI